MKEGSPRYGEVFHLGDYLPCGTLFTGYNMEEHGIADDREFQRMYENGEFGDGLTIDENGDIIIESLISSLAMGTQVVPIHHL